MNTKLSSVLGSLNAEQRLLINVQTAERLAKQSSKLYEKITNATILMQGLEQEYQATQSLDEREDINAQAIRAMLERESFLIEKKAIDRRKATCYREMTRIFKSASETERQRMILH